MHVFILTGTTNFEILTDLQDNYPLFLVCPIVSCIAFIATMIETNRPPFDLSEAESDVVAGYTVEYGGILFGLFYLGEYVNLFTNSIVLILIFFGGWWNLFNYLDHFINLLNIFYFQWNPYIFLTFSELLWVPYW